MLKFWVSEGPQYPREESHVFHQDLWLVITGPQQFRWGVLTQTHKYSSSVMSQGMALSKVVFRMTYLSRPIFPLLLGVGSRDAK